MRRDSCRRVDGRAGAGAGGSPHVEIDCDVIAPLCFVHRVQRLVDVPNKMHDEFQRVGLVRVGPAAQFLS